MTLTKKTKYEVWSYQLSIIAGVLILLSGIVISQWHLALSSNLTWMLGPTKLLTPNLETIILALSICGTFVTVAGILMRKFKVTKMLGVIVIVFSAVSIIEMGGFFVGGVIGIIGGIIAFKAETPKVSQ
ncbi:hypothetical protein C6990_10245 [Nitrosopumilus sp. b3]|uniref:DUF6114 domain-containing protein n=1 Tax=Nitrosopumilus sp. b3 TaxID=2109909 RepID=UPI0015F5F0EC|nr:DUF6114 domain-containing protein [Nitrosopumilus sp. b3]KAF6246252.1 hypothetical protein C6990_10245 [Nitrosopumilus sp. b3]